MPSRSTPKALWLELASQWVEPEESLNTSLSIQQRYGEQPSLTSAATHPLLIDHGS